MNIQELKDFFIASEYSDETKALLLQIISDKTEVTPELVSEIKDILQKELDADFKEVGVDITDDREAQKIEHEYSEELDIIEKDLNSDMEFVEKELNELNELNTKVQEISDEMDAEEIKK